MRAYVLPSLLIAGSIFSSLANGGNNEAKKESIAEDNLVPKRYAEFIKVANSEIGAMRNETARPYHQREDFASKIKQRTSKIDEQIDGTLFSKESHSDHVIFFQIRNDLYLLSNLASAAIKAPDIDIYRGTQKLVEQALDDLAEKIENVALNVKERIYSKVGKHAVLINFDTVSVALTQTQIDIVVSEFHHKMKDNPTLSKFTIFVWSNQNPELADQRGERLSFLLQAFTTNMSIKIMNMDTEMGIIEKIIGGEEFEIKEVLKGKEAQHSRTDNIGTFLSKVAGPNRAVILVE